MFNEPRADGKWTERPSAAQPEMRDSESMFRLLFERSADAITLQDPHTGVFLDVNAASVRLTGAPNKAALLGSNPIVISPARQPDGSLTAAAERGKAIFISEKAACATCHRVRATLAGSYLDSRPAS